MSQRPNKNVLSAVLMVTGRVMDTTDRCDFMSGYLQRCQKLKVLGYIKV